MKKLIVKEGRISEINGEKNDIYRIEIKDNNSINIILKSTGKTMLETDNIHELQHFGFNLYILEQAGIYELESLSRRLDVCLHYSEGKWLYSKSGRVHNLEKLLIENGYWI